MNVMLLGAAGFVGTNLALRLSQHTGDTITLVDVCLEYFAPVLKKQENLRFVQSSFCEDTDFDTLLAGQQVVYHLVSTTVPATSNQHLPQELSANVVMTAQLLDACVRQKVQKVIFISSGGTVYGTVSDCPIREDAPTDPISSYGLQKVTIEKLLSLYRHMYGLDYRVVRLANPYGPYQRPNGVLGAVTTFTYKALQGEEITLYGDGSVVRDFIYIDDAVRGIENIAAAESQHQVFNLGSGQGTSIRQVLEAVQEQLGKPLNIRYLPGRNVDVPVNYLDISRYEAACGKLNPITLREGILRTAQFLKKQIEEA